MKKIGGVNVATSLIIAFLSLVLAGCDSGNVGGSTATTAATPGTLSGVAATGAALSNAAVTLTCGDGSTKTTTADDNGVYSFSLTACSPPFVITATGLVNDSQETLCSVEANTPTTPTVTANTTPLTNALCALISSSGDPLDLVGSAERGKITAAAVRDMKATIAAAIASVLTSAGVGSGYDIVNTQFGANRSGIDQVLDNVKVEITTSSVNLVNAGAATGIVDDMGNNPGAAPADLSGASVSLTRTSTAATVAKLPAGTQDNSVGDAARDALNACFALPAASRGTFAARGGACASLQLASDYKHDGRTGSQEFDSRFLTNSAYDGALFSRPEILRFFSATATDKRALVKFGIKRADGGLDALFTVAENSASTGSKWMLRGNQRLFRIFVNGTVQRRVQTAARSSPTIAKSTFYMTGINAFVDFSAGNASSFSGYVKVTGPGLPSSGLILRRNLAGCDQYFAISPSTTGTPTACASIFRLSSRAATAADTDNDAANFGADERHPATKFTDAQILAIQPLSAYTFAFFTTTAATSPAFTYIERLRSRPYTMGTVTSPGEVDMIRWNAGLSQTTINAITPGSGSTFTGGAAFTVAWTNLPNTPPIVFVQVQTKPSTTLFQDAAYNVAPSASSVTLTNGTPGWPDMSKTGVSPSSLSTNLNLVQLMARNKYDTQIFHDWRY